MAIINGSVSISGKSTVTVSTTKVITSSKTSITGKSSLSLLQTVIIKRSSVSINSKSTVNISGAILKKFGSVVMGGISSLTATIIKVGKEYFNKATLSGNVIYKVAIKGGGNDYMFTNQNFSLTSGDYFELDVTIYDETNAGKDISGSQLTWTMRDITKTIGNGITIINPTNGTILITLEEEDTINLESWNYTHKLVMVDAQGHQTTILKGIATIN